MSNYVEPGDMVRDPLATPPETVWRTVHYVFGETVYMTDGGCMGLEECTDVRLPGELDPTVY